MLFLLLSLQKENTINNVIKIYKTILHYTGLKKKCLNLVPTRRLSAYILLHMICV